MLNDTPAAPVYELHPHPASRRSDRDGVPRLHRHGLPGAVQPNVASATNGHQASPSNEWLPNKNTCQANKEDWNKLVMAAKMVSDPNIQVEFPLIIFYSLLSPAYIRLCLYSPIEFLLVFS